MKLFVKIISIPFLLLHYLFFGLNLIIFDFFQRIAFHLFGYQTHKKTVDWMSFFLIKTLLFIGVRIKFHQKGKIPENVPLIIVSNHQGLFDIPPIAWYFRKYHPKYVSKKELEKGAPGISYNLTHGGSVLIDRKDAKQSLTALAKFGKYIEKNNYAAVIFPEGTRSKDGIPLPFKESGVKILVKYIPSAYIVPITINNGWKISKTTTFFKPFFTTVTIESHEPIAVNSMPFEELILKTENCIKDAIKIS